MVLAGVLRGGLAEDGPERHHVVWDSPSVDHHGSMPLGNGDIALNAWIDPTGELHFYIGKSDSWDDNGRLVKVGKVRVKLDPAPPVTPFRQELSLVDGTMGVRYGDGSTLRVWVDANQPMIRVEADTAVESTVTAVTEMWRTGRETLASIEVSDTLTNRAKPGNQHEPMVVEPDVVLEGIGERTGWYHHNLKSVGPALHAEVQGMTGYVRQDPLLHRTFGAVVTAAGGRRVDPMQLRTAPGKRHEVDVCVVTCHPSTPEAWRQAVEDRLAAAAAVPREAHRAAHVRWWQDFWQRSWIHAVSRPGAAGVRRMVTANAHPLVVGRDQGGGNRFRGEMRGVVVPESLDEPFVLEAEVRAVAGETGRIFDKITPGGSDGFLVDAHPGNGLRFICGKVQQVVPGVLAAERWVKVRAECSGSGWRVSVDGRVVVDTAVDGTADDAAHLSRMAALQRFITASAGRGAYPIKFNGSLFTVPAEGGPGGADYRRWGPGYWWQNTRLPYLSLCASGDYEMMEPLLRMYVDAFLPYHLHRTKRYYGFENAAFYPECVHFWGDVFNESYGWTPVDQRQDPLQEAGWHKWEWVAGPELVWMMLELYDHTGDRALWEKRIVPTADAVTGFFDAFYPTDAAGKLVMHPSQALETWWECTNPMPELAGLHAILRRLLAEPAGVTPPEVRARWQAFAAKLPSLPVRQVAEGPAWAPAEKFARKSNVENPELYVVFPFRLCSFEKPNRDLGIRALRHRWDRGHSGWRQDDLFMAYLGLTEEAVEALVSRARSHDPGSRFPAFWGPNYDWIPDQDHGGVLVKGLQSLLMQTDGQTIHLLPAWPAGWDCSFKLHAPRNTIVQGKVAGGKVVDLTVIPESRRADVVIHPVTEER